MCESNYYIHTRSIVDNICVVWVTVIFSPVCSCTTLPVQLFVKKWWWTLSCNLWGNKSNWTYESGEKASPLPPWPWWIAFPTLVYLLLGERKPCNYRSLVTALKLSAFFFWLSKKNLVYSQFPSLPNEPVKSHILPRSHLEVKISRRFPENEMNKCHCSCYSVSKW